MPEAHPHKPPKQLIDILWFQSLWQLFPRLAKEHENLSEPSRLPHDFSIKLKAGAKPHISPTYQMDKKRTSELLLFLQKAIADNLIVATPCKYISASFMVPRSDPNKPYRCKSVISATKRFSICNLFLTFTRSWTPQIFYIHHTTNLHNHPVLNTQIDCNDQLHWNITPLVLACFLHPDLSPAKNQKNDWLESKVYSSQDWLLPLISKHHTNNQNILPINEKLCISSSKAYKFISSLHDHFQINTYYFVC